MLKINVRRTVRIVCLFMALLLIMGIFSTHVAATSETIAIITNGNEPVATSAKETNGNNSLGTICWIIISVSLTAIISGYRSYKKEQKLHASYGTLNATLTKENQALRNLKKATSLELANVQSRYAALEDWRNRAIKHSPEIVRIVRSSYSKDRAEAFEKKYSFLESAEPTYNNYSKFENALADYQQLSDEVKMMLTISIQSFQEKRNLALTNYIETSRSHLVQADNSTTGTTQDDLLKLTRVIEWYENIPAEVKSEMPSTVITNLKMKKATAEYSLELASPACDADFEIENGNTINKALDSIVRSAFKLFGKARSLVTDKIKESRKLLKEPFEVSYYDDDDDFEENENATGDTKSDATTQEGNAE